MQPSGVMHVNRPGPVLFIAPHTDDAELGCGGTMARFLEEGREIHVAAFSTAESSLPPGFAPGALRDEMLESLASMGVRRENIFVSDFPVRRLSYHRQEVLEELVRIGRSVKPEMVFLPSASDLHQDHQVCFNEGLRAFKSLTVLGYELPWNHVVFSAQGFVTLEPRHIESKWRALLHYKSQLSLERPYFSRDFIEGLARLRGVQVKAQFAEAFEVVRIRF